jgi:hypothetical protein
VPAVLALKAASTSIPIVFFVAADPIALGLVEVCVADQPDKSKPGECASARSTSRGPVARRRNRVVAREQ